MTCFTFFYPMASATAYGQKPKFVRAEHSATAKGENCAYGPTLLDIQQPILNLRILFFFQTKSNQTRQKNSGNYLSKYIFLLHKKITKINMTNRQFRTCILLTSSNNQISEFRIPNIYNEILFILFFA